jgi:ketosteroid isomerase-like protein
MVRKLLILALLSTVSCKEKPSAREDKPTTPATETETKATPRNVVAKPEPAATPARPDLAQADVEALVDQWLSAQNEGDFGAYSATYAQRITGIKRAGNRETTYNREDWLADRKRMFRKPMKVEGAKRSIRTSPTSAVVRFEQTWASGKFKDVGPKQLIVIREAGALRIAREEMQASTVLSTRHGLPVELSELYFGANSFPRYLLWI